MGRVSHSREREALRDEDDEHLTLYRDGIIADVRARSVVKLLAVAVAVAVAATSIFAETVA